VQGKLGVWERVGERRFPNVDRLSAPWVSSGALHSREVNEYPRIEARRAGKNPALGAGLGPDADEKVSAES
jgi:hypothetical protein